MKKNIHKPFMIAEVGLNHMGKFDLAKKYIKKFSEIGIDAIKFQSHIPEYESTNQEKFRVKFSYKDKTRFDYWKRTEFSIDEWAELKKHVEEKNMEFMF